MKWPFDVWLRIAVKRFGLAPTEFWAMPLREWLVLMKATQPASLDRKRLDALIQTYPDIDPKGNQSGSTK